MTQTPQPGNNDKKAQVQDYFSRTAESYVASFSHRSGDDMQRLIELGEWNPQLQALDIATGGGHTALAVAPYVEQVTVTDLTPRMLEKARDFILAQGVTNARFQVADAEQLPFASERFDRVTCRIAPHHFPDLPQFVQEVARVLKPAGIFLLIALPRSGKHFSKRRDCPPNIWNSSVKHTHMMIGLHVRKCPSAKKRSWHSLF